MVREEIITQGPIHIYCSKQFNPIDSRGKGQPEITIEVNQRSPLSNL